MSAHTPGPWRVSEIGAGFEVTSPAGVMVAQAQQAEPREWASDHAKRRANARLIAAAPDHALFGAAVCAGKARWEPWAPVSAMGGKGEVCVGGMRYATDLDEFGMPVLHDALRAAIAKAVQS